VERVELPYISSRGDMKMSLREMTCARGSAVRKSDAGYPATHVLMFQMLQQLQFPVCSLGQDRGAEGLHDLLDGHALPGELVFGGAGRRESVYAAPQEVIRRDIRTRQDRMHPFPPAGGQSTCGSNQFLVGHNTGASPPQSPAYLDVISKVVPKIWARTNSAMMEGRGDCVGKVLFLMSCDIGQRKVVGQKVG
jgi:hypothetical protein